MSFSFVAAMLAVTIANLGIYFLTCNKTPLFFQFLCHFVGKCHELRNGQLLRALRHNVLFEERCRRLAPREYLLQTHAKHLPPLVEDGLDQSAEEQPVASEVRRLVACHPYDGTFHLWWRVEDILVNSEKIFHVVPSLNEN